MAKDSTRHPDVDQFGTDTGRKSKRTDDGRPSEPVSLVDGTATWTQPSSPVGRAMRYQRRYASALVPVVSSAPAAISSREKTAPGVIAEISPKFSAPASPAGALQSVMTSGAV